mmetsp:Transcript_70450/g.206610  ORF Transcript_70450/g.206610 Transcript_70450/m.206610 type:complete len:898 (+) Transcript_70450:80-2773(+)
MPGGAMRVRALAPYKPVDVRVLDFEWWVWEPPGCPGWLVSPAPPIKRAAAASLVGGKRNPSSGHPSCRGLVCALGSSSVHGSFANARKPSGSDWTRVPSQHGHGVHLIRGNLAVLRGILPLALVPDKLHEPVDGLLRGDGPLNAVVPNVEVNLAHAAAHVAEVSVGHLAGSVHDAAHDGDADAGQVPGAILDLRGSLLEVEQGAAARRAADELGLGDAHARRLEQVERGLDEVRRGQGLPCVPEHALAKAVHEQAAELRGGLDHEVVLVLVVILLVAEPVHHRHSLAGRNGRQLAHEATAHEGDAILGLGPQEDHPRLHLLESGLHLGGSLLAGAEERIPAKALLALLRLGRLHHDGRARRHVRAALADHTQGDIQELLDLDAHIRRDHALDHNHIDALESLLHVHVRAERQVEALADGLGVHVLEDSRGDSRQHSAVLVEGDVERELALPARLLALAAAVSLLEGLIHAVALSGLADGAQGLARRRLVLRILRERHADGVAKSVQEQSADANGGLDAAIGAAASLSHAEVQGVVPAELVHLACEGPVGVDHHLGVRGLHAEDEVVEVVLPADLAELDGGSNHAFRGVAVLEEDALRQRPVVHADAHGLVLLLELQHQGDERSLNVLLGLLDVLVRQTLDGVKGLATVRKVARVHTDLVDELGTDQRHLGSEVDVGDDRGGVAVLQQALLDALAGLGLANALDRDANNVNAHVGALLDLGHGPLHVVRQRGGHRLRGDGVIGPDGNAADHNGPGLAADRLLGSRAVPAVGHGRAGDDGGGGGDGGLRLPAVAAAAASSRGKRTEGCATRQNLRLVRRLVVAGLGHVLRGGRAGSPLLQGARGAPGIAGSGNERSGGGGERQAHTAGHGGITSCLRSGSHDWNQQKSRPERPDGAGNT